MVTYRVHTPQWLKLIFPRQLVWSMPAGDEPAVYLTFDDGPNPLATPFVLDQLSQAGGKGTFFCVGENVSRYPELYNRLKAEGHSTGNHTYNHLNGWKTTVDNYLDNIKKADSVIGSHIFRPPYGKIKRRQVRRLTAQQPGWKVYMWDIISGDFDAGISAQQCADNVLRYVKPGSIVVFHDSQKAWDRMQHALPQVIDHCVKNGWQLKALPQ